MKTLFPTFNLLEKYSLNKEEWSNKIKDFKSFTTSHKNFQIGDKISFIGGYNDDMIFITEILGFNNDGEIYVLWDCYWFAIKDDSRRNINKI